MFRRQVSINPALPWNVLEPSLQAATILGQRTSEGMLCTICQECTIYSQPLRIGSAPTAVAGTLTNCHISSFLPPPRRLKTLQRICVGWNKGTCSRPQCAFRHICATCRKSHKARDFPDTPAESRVQDAHWSTPTHTQVDPGHWKYS